jgi:hypothetical protein
MLHSIVTRHTIDIPTGSPVFDLRNGGHGTRLADVADLGGVLALVVVGDDANQRCCMLLRQEEAPYQTDMQIFGKPIKKLFSVSFYGI